MNEKDVRRWLKVAMGSDVVWTEPSIGSTVGKPDAELCVAGSWLPVELKFAEIKKNRFIVKMRPAQIRYHFMAHRNGMKTAIMVGVERQGNLEVYVMSGRFVKELLVPVLIKDWIGSSIDEPQEVKRRIIQTLSADWFWTETKWERSRHI
jgi:hypothetical protein